MVDTVEPDREQREIDTEVADSAAVMDSQDQRSREHGRRDAALDRRQAAAVAREHDSDRRDDLLDERERRVTARERVADQREIDAEVAS